MFLTNTRNEYLSETGHAVSDRNRAALVEPELVSGWITRLKIGDRYIACSNSSAYLTDKSDDANLFLTRNNEFFTIQGMKLSLNGVLKAQDPILPSGLWKEYLQHSEVIKTKFTRDGWATWRPIYGEDLIETARAKILENPEARIGNLFALGEQFPMFLQNQQLKALLNSILGEYHLTTFSSNVLRSSDPDLRHFHVDYPYHDLESPYPDELLGVQVIFTLDDFTVENGATSYVPNSFYKACYPHDVDISQTRQMTVPKGSIVVFRADLWHSQGVNTTSSPRVALLANFSPLNVSAKDPVADQASGILQIVNGKVVI